MKNTIYILALICLFISSCVMRDGKVERISFNDRQIETMEDVNTQRDLLLDGKRAPITLLINAYNNNNLNYDVRMASLEALAESKDPLVIEAIQKSIRNAELIDLDMMIKSIALLAKYGDTESINALTSALKKSEAKIMDLREVIVTAIGENGSDDHIITLLELYEISRINHQKNSQLLAIALGNMGDDRAIPVLMEIAQNKEHNLITRKLAVDILAKKEAIELVDYFIELLGDPSTRQSMNDFALEVMGDLDNQQMILALLESYQIGKQQYYSMLIRLMDIMSEQNNVQLKPVIIEVALTEHLPYHIRIKAIKSLANFGDPSVIDKIIILLDEPKNYIFYDHIVNLILSMDVMSDYEGELRQASFNAMNNQKELEE
ncbi:MAG: HEAT repeat domain-containing protein [Candidatus Neomarinimicrobiota bacterium]